MADPRLQNYLFQNSYRRYSGSVAAVGPFHRKRSRSQTLADDVEQINTGLLWGKIPRSGKCATAQAYFGPLPQGDHGIEFFTTIRPQQTGLPPGFGANWLLDDTALLARFPTPMAAIWRR